jgi:hypothetical protein
VQVWRGHAIQRGDERVLGDGCAAQHVAGLHAQPQQRQILYVHMGSRSGYANLGGEQSVL